jgi:signal transduction histidine kinase
MLIPLAVLCCFAVLFVGWEEVERALLPTVSTGVKHGLLTIRAAVVTAVASTIVYLLMRHQQTKLSTTAVHIARLLESYKAGKPTPGCFENPHLVHCRTVLDCRRTDCPMYDRPGERCWQHVALSGRSRGPGAEPVAIQQCHECPVYRRSSPDRLTELGESFNSLMFLLDREARQIGHMRAQLVEKEKMVALGQIAAGVAHEVGNPLSSISAVVQMLKRSGSTEAQRRELDLIQTHIRRISTTVRQLVSLSRPVRDRWELIDVRQVLEQVVRLVSFDRRARNVTVTFDPPDELASTYALPGQLQQVFINLALNALDSMPKGGALVFEAGRLNGDLSVSVRDTGSGIPPEIGRRIFEPFFTSKEPGQGTGLGLSVSYGIIESHGGRIDFDSAVGKGSTFSVLIPIRTRPPEVSHETTDRLVG